MSKQLDNSFVRFSQHRQSTPLLGLSITIGVLLAAGLLMAVFIREWAFTALFLLALVGLFVYSYFTSRVTRKLAAASEESRIDWESALPEVQRQSLNIEVIELSRILDVTTEQIGDLQSA